VTKLDWDSPGERLFETGLDRGVLYLPNSVGVPWSGLISVSESPSGGDPKAFYMDGIKYQNRSAPEEFSGTLVAFTYPDEFGECDGTVALLDGLYAGHQPRRPFNLSYRTKIGNDLAGLGHGYKIHLLYNVLASPSQKDNQSTSESADIINFSWELTTTPVTVDGIKPTAHLIIDTTKTDPEIIANLELILYGTETLDPGIPTPEDLFTIFYNLPPDLFTSTFGAGF
jgi:hypothetical protein